MNIKKTLRKEVLARRTHLSESEWKSKSESIANALLQMDVVNQVNNIASFVDFRNEVSTDAINRWILSKGKSLYLPLIDMSKRLMTFYKVNDLNELIRSDYGIMEPDPQLHEAVDPNSIDLFITPGVAFDPHGYRLGYGGGFYDHLFAGIKNEIPKIALAFDLQCVDELPIEPFDRRITHLVTESGVKTF